MPGSIPSAGTDLRFQLSWISNMLEQSFQEIKRTMYCEMSS